MQTLPPRKLYNIYICTCTFSIRSSTLVVLVVHVVVLVVHVVVLSTSTCSSTSSACSSTIY